MTPVTEYSFNFHRRGVGFALFPANALSMKYAQILLSGFLFFISLSAAVWANPAVGYFSSGGVKFHPRDFIIVHEEKEGRIRLHFTDLTLNKNQKKYLAGNRGNNFSANTVQFYIPVEVSPDGVVRQKDEDVDTYGWVGESGFWPLPANQLKVNGTLRSLRIRARGDKRFRGKDCSYDFLVEGNVYSQAERARKAYPRIKVGKKDIEVDASWHRDAVTRTVGITIHESNRGSGQEYVHAKDLQELIAALRNGSPHIYHGLKLTPQKKGFLLQTHAALGGSPREVLISRAQALKLASQLASAANHIRLPR